MRKGNSMHDVDMPPEECVTARPQAWMGVGRDDRKTLRAATGVDRVAISITILI